MKILVLVEIQVPQADVPFLNAQQVESAIENCLHNDMDLPKHMYTVVASSK